MKKIIFLIVLALSVSGFIMSQDPVIEYDVKKPDASSHWRKNTTKNIIWDKKGDSDALVKIRLYNALKTIKIMNVTTNDTPNNGKFEWTIPMDVNPGQYTIKVRNKLNSSWGFSKVFEIKKALIAGTNKDVIKKVIAKPKFKPAPGMFNPVIEGYFSVPIMEPLRPGTKLILEGKKFGNSKGKIFIKGNFPGGQFELINVKWESSEKASGVVPPSVNGQPNQSVKIVLVTSLNFKSDPVKNIAFEGRIEKKMKMSDVVVLQCGQDANHNTCNSNNYVPEFIGTAIYGFHKNTGTIGDDEGEDRWQLKLKNGWVFKSYNILMWDKTSENERLEYPSPAIPVGESEWYPVFYWKVTPGDYVKYLLQVIVEGPIGTHYK